MRVAVLCDIHGNLPALQAVLAEVDEAGVDLVVFGGDVAAGPMPVSKLRLTLFVAQKTRRETSWRRASFGRRRPRTRSRCSSAWRADPTRDSAWNSSPSN
jgi:3',5'-cyclic AMP phosphodiesterase CpdA